MRTNDIYGKRTPQDEPLTAGQMALRVTTSPNNNIIFDDALETVNLLLT